MKKNEKVIISIFTTASLVVLLGLSGFLYQTNANNNIGAIDTKDKITSKDNEYYYVEPGLEEYAKVIKPAVENYLNQDISIPVKNRNSRLSLYFAGDSPVYGYGQINLSTSVNKSSAMVTSVMPSDAEGVDLSFQIIVELTLYTNNKPNLETQTYLVTLKNTSDNSYITYDIWKVES